ncbi:MAG: hypothetical protein LBV20_00040, partial [Treponema sp.]|nr:hypothetical protein [Treponema sp.]
DLLGIVGDKVYQHGTEVPLFHLNGQDNATTNVTATWGFGVGTFGADVGTLSTNKYDVDILVAAANGTVVDANLASADANPVRLESTTYTGPMSPAAIGAGGFGMTLEVPDVVGTDGKNGMVKVAIEVPVAAYDLAKGNPQTWYIRGGLNPHLLDPGQFPQQGANSQIAFGGAVVVGFGTLTGIPKVELNPSF